MRPFNSSTSEPWNSYSNVSPLCVVSMGLGLGVFRIGPMTLTTACHLNVGDGGSHLRYLTHAPSDPRMIEVAAFSALVLQSRDKVTSPLGALWLQGLERVEARGA